jgi:hypothetical protein
MMAEGNKGASGFSRNPLQKLAPQPAAGSFKVFFSDRSQSTDISLLQKKRELKSMRMSGDGSRVCATFGT